MRQLGLTPVQAAFIRTQIIMWDEVADEIDIWKKADKIDVCISLCGRLNDIERGKTTKLEWPEGGIHDDIMRYALHKLEPFVDAHNALGDVFKTRRR